jgi:hypothetical protein
MILGIVIEIATILGTGGAPPVSCFATTNWNSYVGNDWNLLNENYNNCL